MKFNLGFIVLQAVFSARRTYAAVNAQKIVCFTGFWTRYSPSPMQYTPSKALVKPCDALVYAFATVNVTTWKIEHRGRHADIDSGGFSDAVAKKKENPNLKVILGFGGEPYENIGHVIHYSNMMANSSRRQTFVQSAVDFLRTHRFDGLELHWRYPGSSQGLPADKDNYLLLVQELHAAFARYNFTLIAAVPFLRSDILAGFHIAELNKYLDYFYVLTLGMNVYDKQQTDNASPLRRRSFDVPGTVEGEENVESVLNIYVSLGASKEKLIFGIPFEHHVFKLVDSSKDYLKAPSTRLTDIAGPFSNVPGILFYHEVCAKIQSGKWIRKRHQESGLPYAVNHGTNEWVSYEDEQTVTEKVNFVKQEGYGGVFVWLMDNDDFRGVCGEKHSLLNSIKRAMMKPS